jgi:hypothetical protein
VGIQSALASAIGFAQQVYERGVDTGVLDASGREQQVHHAAPCRWHGSRSAPLVPRVDTEAERAQNVTTALLILQDLGTEQLARAFVE